MINKAIHHFSRGLILGFEIAGMLAVLAFIAWLGLLMRLSHGPLNVDFLTQRIEKSMNEQQSGFVFDIGTTELIWGGRFEPFELQMDGVRISRTDRTPVLDVDKISIQLSKRNLLIGRLVPRAIQIHGPALRVIRWEDGHFTLNLAAPTEPVAAPPPAPDQPELIKGLLQQLQERRLPLVGGLNQVGISDAVLFYEDKMLHVAWKSQKSDISFARGGAGISSEAHIVLDLDAQHSSVVDMRAYYSWDTRTTNMLAAFRGFVPALAAQGSESLKSLTGLNLPLSGSLAVALDPAFTPGMTRFALVAEAGAFGWPGLYDAPIQVKSAVVNGYFNLKTWEGALDEVKADLGGPVAEIQGQCVLRHGQRLVTAKATLTGMPVDDLKTYWPESLAPDPRAWVTKHLSKGVTSKATLDLDLDIADDETKKVTVNKAEGEIDFTGIKVDYFPPLMPVTGVDGKANYDKSSFNLDLKGGKLGDMTVGKTEIHITGLDHQDETAHSKIDVAAALHGPLKTALEVLDSKPLGYPHDLGLQTAQVGGEADINVGFKFPLYGGLQVKDVRVEAKAKVRDVLLKNVLADYALTGGPMDVAVDNGTLTVAGTGKLGGMPLTFSWFRNFAPGAAAAASITAKLPLDAAALVKFGAPEDMNPGGTMDSDVTYTEASDGTAQLSLKGDITHASFEVPFAGFAKDAGIPGTVSFLLHLKNGVHQSMTGLSLQTEKTSLKGDLTFDPNGLRSAAFGQVLMGDTDIALNAEKNSDNGYNVKISGKQIDLSKVLSGDGKPGSDTEAAKKTAPLALDLGVTRVITGKDKAIDNAKIFMRRNEWQRIEQLEMDGSAGGGAMTVKYEPSGAGHSLHVAAANAGAALSALGITNGVRKGKLSVEATPTPKGGPRDMTGRVILTDFTLVDAPVLARLLNAMSLTGIMELLNGKGIAFSKASAGFLWTDRGQPGSVKNVRDIHIKDGETSGSSMGLTFEGHIDNWNNTYDMDGTIIPVSDINKMLSSIPLVGNILTANGEGVFAATYTIRGPKDQPTVTVNPLAVLAPGILRKLFFEK